MPSLGTGRSCRVLGVIPARWGSTRFPGKMLADLDGTPLIVQTYNNSLKASSLDDVIVATDDERIQNAIEGVGGKTVMTSPELPSGSDRVHAAIKDISADIIVNIQGDEPALPPEVIDNAVELLLADDDFDVTTAASPYNASDTNDVNAVKVVLDSSHKALYFSRSMIPFQMENKSENCPLYLHIGLYVYRREVLRQFCSWPQPAIEKCEKLEQLRLLYNGINIGVVIADSFSSGIDTPADLEKYLAK
ncbi:MAG: 3-deoxy-manno-octulosonate cytidylyltransferase [Candidatus Electryonea clarkiae]|nr:3-deoxy-manno-octulosonate cytidylyltransferase [Candidatus Electryonea clarkiae]MDP8285315.1 3-deoxy-manno-octulosonate cytidylyltransferase [Candidatus Electryonea clarkiae]